MTNQDRNRRHNEAVAGIRDVLPECSEEWANALAVLVGSDWCDNKEHTDLSVGDWARGYADRIADFPTDLC